MKYCSNCGSELKEGAQVCLSCGVFISKQRKDKSISGESQYSGVNILGFITKILFIFVFHFYIVFYYYPHHAYWLHILTLVTSIIVFISGTIYFILALVKKNEKTNVFNEILFFTSVFLFTLFFLIRWF